jgi:hypothetical protein
MGLLAPMVCKYGSARHLSHTQLLGSAEIGGETCVTGFWMGDLAMYHEFPGGG